MPKPLFVVDHIPPISCVHGPLCYQGLDVPNLYTEQTTARLQALLQYGPQADDLMGSLIRYTAEAFQMEAGVTGLIFEAPIAIEPAITNSWIKECWLDMQHYDIHITEDIPDFTVPRAGDKELMRVFVTAGFCNEEIASLNRCRLFCHVIFISDICTGAGEKVDSRWLQGKESNTYEHYSWPRTGKPTAGEWSLWTRAIYKALNMDSYRNLPRPLGPWLWPWTQEIGGMWSTTNKGFGITPARDGIFTQRYPTERGWRDSTLNIK